MDFRLLQNWLNFNKTQIIKQRLQRKIRWLRGQISNLKFQVNDQIRGVASAVAYRSAYGL